MANYHKRNSIRAVQWDPENAQSFEDIKKLIAENPGIGWKMPLKNWFGKTAVTAPLSCTMTPSSAFGRLYGT